MWKIVATFASMVVSGIITFAVVALFLMDLGLRLHGNYEYYGRYPVLICGAAAIGFLAPAIVVAYLRQRGYTIPWKIVATLALMVGSGVITYAVEFQIIWELGMRLQGVDNYYWRYPAVGLGLHGFAIIGFLAPGMIVWYLHRKSTTNGQSP